MDTRRKVLGKLGLGAAAAGLAVGGTAALATRQRARAVPSHPDDAQARAHAAGDPGNGPWWLLAPLTRGAHLGSGWHVAHLGGVDRGASVMTLQHQDGDVARVHLCHHSGSPKGLAHTELVDMILMDGGQGDKATDETLGRVLLGLASVVRDNELTADGDVRALASMQPHDERVSAYGAETLT